MTLVFVLLGSISIVAVAIAFICSFFLAYRFSYGCSTICSNVIPGLLDQNVCYQFNTHFMIDLSLRFKECNWCAYAFNESVMRKHFVKGSCLLHFQCICVMRFQLNAEIKILKKFFFFLMFSYSMGIKVAKWSIARSEISNPFTTKIFLDIPIHQELHYINID